MATPKFNTKSPTIRRIMREATELTTSPSPDYHATPLETDLFEWHFTLLGPPNSVYAGGIYHGRIVLPPTYPLRPPSFRFSTPSGRFEPNREICLSISGHHEETWQPAWGLRTAIVALRSFMETSAKGQVGGMDCSDEVRRRLAGESRGWRCGTCGRSNEEVMGEVGERCREMGEGRKEIEVPAELKMGFRDEMKGLKAEEVEKMDRESTHLAEGFVQTGLRPVPVELPVDPAASPLERAQPEFPIPQPTRTTPLPQPPRDNVGAVYQDQALRRRGGGNEGVPMWIDRLIILVGVVLAAMVAKVFLGA